MNFLAFKKYAFCLSGLLVTLSIIVLLVPGLNLGVDFAGGTYLERQTEQNVTTGGVRQTLEMALPGEDFSGASIQILDRPNQFVVRTTELSGEDLLRIDKALEAEFGGLIELRTELVGPVVGRELVQKAIIAVIISSIGILAYITLRFEYRFATVAVACLLHDVLLVLGFFALTGREINSPFVAAVLTVLGYSINDTIVIFDRIRENLRFKKKESYAELVNNSLNQSLRRTISTSITTFLVVLMLVIFGGAAIKDFALALMIGIIVGTYSSILLAGPLWLAWVERKK